VRNQHHREARRAARALRAAKGTSIVVDGENSALVHAVLDKMAASPIASAAAMEGHTGKRIRNVINIGIGGSDSVPSWRTRR